VQVVTLWTAVFLKETRRQGELEEEKVDSGIHRE
jgi:hypothetical protein